MGGPGSGRHGGFRVGRRYRREADNPAGVSRVVLEHQLARALAIGDTALADAIAAELATRTWQWTNPYEAWLPSARGQHLAPQPLPGHEPVGVPVLQDPVHEAI